MCAYCVGLRNAWGLVVQVPEVVRCLAHTIVFNRAFGPLVPLEVGLTAALAHPQRPVGIRMHLGGRPSWPIFVGIRVCVWEVLAKLARVCVGRAGACAGAHTCPSTAWACVHGGVCWLATPRTTRCLPQTESPLFDIVYPRCGLEEVRVKIDEQVKDVF
jgi:hypothetical protein